MQQRNQFRTLANSEIGWSKISHTGHDRVEGSRVCPRYISCELPCGPCTTRGLSRFEGACPHRRRTNPLHGGTLHIPDLPKLHADFERVSIAWDRHCLYLISDHRLVSGAESSLICRSFESRSMRSGNLARKMCDEAQ